ncbi:hypothetical protein DSL72_002359 [Monilinia vaccinii-corymbosi]|uniref:Uncharacterized protein n=1 Tax=Monilinia vaccinii-corymbosi TaxID=61207 RepID=A0A8A3PCF0_9HELO|nr:hypothetical protein DSL72_002359 [Monilinia vaccinii-corymbosi]
MTPASFNTSDSLEEDQDLHFYHQDIIFPIIESSIPNTPTEDSLLNSTFDFQFDENEDHKPDGLVDHELMETQTHPSLVSTFGSPYPEEVDPLSAALGFNLSEPGLPPPLQSGDVQAHQQAYRNFLLSKATYQSRVHVDNGHGNGINGNANANGNGTPSPAKAHQTNRAAKAKRPSAKVTFIDPMHPHAHLKHTAIFCCQIPICIRAAQKVYRHSLTDFVKHYSKPTIATPLYDPKRLVVPQADNPDLRIPMLLVTGARVYRVEKAGENPVVRMFVCDVTHDKRKYWELLRGGAVDQMGWMEELRKMVAGEGRSSTWKCRNHGHVWDISILEQSLEDRNGRDDGATASTLSTPSLGASYDSGYTSASGRVAASAKKEPAIDPPAGFSIGLDAHPHSFIPANNLGSHDGLKQDVAMANTIGEHEYLRQIQEQALEDLDIGEADEGAMGDDELVEPAEYFWADALLDEVNMFIDDGSDEIFGFDFENI